jgi:hypothetical protein
MDCRLLEKRHTQHRFQRFTESTANINLTLQIFATDLDTDAIEKRRGFSLLILL